jgi:flagellar biosynthetic protein FlhB
MRLGTSLTKLTIVVALSAVAIQAYLPTFLGLSSAEPPQILFAIKGSAAKVGYFLAGALMVLALVDFLFQKWNHGRSLRMTKQEVREEMKISEGDPTVRHRRREAHRKLAQAGELPAVAAADVVIIDPSIIAVALRYDPETMPAPIVVAMGKGEMAQRIRVLAAEHRVAIIERQDLARSLHRQVKIGDSIPAEMFAAFADIMAYVYSISGQTPIRPIDMMRAAA